MAPLAKKVALTLAGIALYRASQQIVLPGIDVGVLGEFFGGAPGDMSGGGGRRFAGILSRTGGVFNYVSASVIVLLLSGVIPWVRRLREGGEPGGRRLDRLIISVTAVLAASQAWGVALFLESVRGPASGSMAVPVPGWGFRLTTMATIAAATLFAVWLAHQITDKGLGNGVAVLLVTDILAELPTAALSEYWGLVGGIRPVRFAAYAVVAFAAVTTLTVAMTTAVRRLRLEPVDGSGDDTGASLPIHLNPVGVLPIYAAQSVLFSLGLSPGQALSFPGAYWFLQFTLIALLTYLYSAITFSAPDAVARAGRYGYRLAGVGSAEAAAKYVASVRYRVVALGAGFLCLLAAVPFCLERWLAVSPALGSLFGPSLLIVCAVVMDGVRQVRSEREACSGEADEGRSWVAVLFTETAMEVQIAATVTRRAGIPARVRCDRVLSASGTLALWEVSRPRFPSLTPHRRLGGGEAAMLVPGDRESEARRVLESRGIDLEP